MCEIVTYDSYFKIKNIFLFQLTSDFLSHSGQLLERNYIFINKFGRQQFRGLS